jgi:hypothetical protein
MQAMAFMSYFDSNKKKGEMRLKRKAVCEMLLKTTSKIEQQSLM